MKDVLDKIRRILDQQVSLLAEKSEAGTRLDEKEIDSIGSMARTWIQITSKPSNKELNKATIRGRYTSNEALINRARDE